MPRWATAAEAAKHAKVHVATVRQAIHDGALPAYPVGKSGIRYRLDLDEVDAWMKSRSWEPTRREASA